MKGTYNTCLFTVVYIRNHEKLTTENITLKPVSISLHDSLAVLVLGKTKPKNVFRPTLNPSKKFPENFLFYAD